jgi:hypothetical protein
MQLLLSAPPEGLVVGEIQEELDTSPPLTLSHMHFPRFACQRQKVTDSSFIVRRKTYFLSIH